MEFVTLTEKEFETFSWNHPCGTFHQMPGWGRLKETNGWKYDLVGVKEKGKIVAASLLLSKRVFASFTIFYAPRGFLLDYDDEQVLRFFTEQIKAFAKKKKAIFVKLDPYLIYKQRDIDGNVVEGGIDHSNVLERMKKLGYRHLGFTMGMENLQPRWAFALDLTNTTEEELLSKMKLRTRNKINRNGRMHITTRVIDSDELEKFTDIMSVTAKRRKFIDRPFSYYQNMISCLGKNVMIVLTELHGKEYLASIEKNLASLRERITENEEKLKGYQKGGYKLHNQIKIDEAEIERLLKCKKETETLVKEKGDPIVLGGMLYLKHGTELLSLLGGTYEEYISYSSAISTNWNMIQYALKNGYKKYNFYGITGNFTNKEDEMYGLYEFKRGFGGHVEEYIGEFDLVISPFLYHLYRIAFGGYQKLKHFWARRG